MQIQYDTATITYCLVTSYNGKELFALLRIPFFT